MIMLRQFLITVFLLIFSVQIAPASRVFHTSALGILSDSVIVQTAGLQRAVDSVASIGGTLVVDPGTYVSGTLRLPSGARLRLSRGATILGSINPFDYQGYAVGSASSTPQADKCSEPQMGLIVAHDASDILIEGEGTIDGRGLEVALAIDSLHHTGVRVDPSYNRRRMRPSIRPKLLDIEFCTGVRILGVNLRASASWGLSLNGCTDVVISGIDFVNRAYWNNDGIDIADCRDVVVEKCRINSADDGIVLKSFNPDSGCCNIRISDCDVRSSANAIKMGTESFGGFRRVRGERIRVADTFRSAIAIESVDGAVVDSIEVDGIDAVNTGNAFFVRLGHRRGEHPGSMSNVVIRNLRCEIPFGRPDEAYDLRGPDINTIHNPFPNSITGLPDAIISNITLENVEVSHPGRGTKGMGYIGRYRWDDVPEMRDSYPEFHMFGELPAYGLYARHIDGLHLRNVRFTLRAPDYRPAIVASDVTPPIP